MRSNVKIRWHELLAAIFVCLLGTAVVTFADDCSYRCEEVEECKQADVPCPECSSACGSEEPAEFNPAGVIIKARLSDGSEKATLQDDEAICSRVGECTINDSLPFKVCYQDYEILPGIILNGCYSFGGMPPNPPPTCKTCKQFGTWENATVEDWSCTGNGCG